MAGQEHRLNLQQIRVLACLMEKHLATPTNYPLTFNALKLACNQKSNRSLIMDLTEGQVGHTVSELVELDYARVEYGDRANKVSHRTPAALKINRQQQAVLAMLMLREPLTLVEIKARTERLAPLEDLDDVRTVLESLIDRDDPLVCLIPKAPGRREDRYTHLFCAIPDFASIESNRPTAKHHHIDKAVNIGTDKLAELEARIEKLELALKGTSIN